MLGRLGIGLLNGSLLWGLAAVAVPVLLHLWRRRRREVVDWGAMMFLDDKPGAPTRRSPRINDRLLLAVRMALLALLVLALTRPYRADADAAGRPTADGSKSHDIRTSANGRTFVLAIDRSASMDDRRDGISPRALALRWARRFVAAMGLEDSAALIDTGARSRPRIEPPTRDKALLARSLAELENADGSAPRGGPSDLTAALSDALRILADAPGDGVGDVILLTDNRRFPWRPDEALRWDLARELHRRFKANGPRLWAVLFGDPSAGSERENAASLGSLDLKQSPALANRPIVASTVVSNGGSRPISPIGQLLVDGRAIGPALKVGPIAPRGQAPLSFTATIAAPGVHLLSITLDSDDTAEGLVEVVERLPVLIVDGKPSAEHLGGQADFLRIALDPRALSKADGDGPGASAFRTRVVPAEAFGSKDLAADKDTPRVLALAGVAELNDKVASAVDRFVAAGGGLLVLLGENARASFFSGRGWFPGKLDGSALAVPTRLDPASFSGSTMGRFVAVGEMGNPLAQVEVFRHRGLVPGSKAVVSAKLASGDPWCVERPSGKGRVLVVASALDGHETTLPINPDFVPLAHEWILSLARGSAASAAKSLQAGEPWMVTPDPPPLSGVKTLPLRVPGGRILAAPVARGEVRIDDTDAPGVYRLGLGDPRGGFAYAVVDRDARESDPTPLSKEDIDRLGRGWPFAFAPGDPGLIEQIRSAESSIGESTEARPIEFWRALILAALVGLCVESWLTRRLR